MGRSVRQLSGHEGTRSTDKDERLCSNNLKRRRHEQQCGRRAWGVLDDAQRLQSSGTTEKVDTCSGFIASLCLPTPVGGGVGQLQIYI